MLICLSRRLGEYSGIKGTIGLQMAEWDERRRAEKDERRRKTDWERQVREDERIRIQERNWAAEAPQRKANDAAKKRLDAERELDARFDYVEHFGPRNAFLLTFAKWTFGGIILAIIVREAPPGSIALLVLGGPIIGVWRGVSIFRSVS